MITYVEKSWPWFRYNCLCDFHNAPLFLCPCLLIIFSDINSNSPS